MTQTIDPIRLKAAAEQLEWDEVLMWIFRLNCEVVSPNKISASILVSPP